MRMREVGVKTPVDVVDAGEERTQGFHRRRSCPDMFPYLTFQDGMVIFHDPCRVVILDTIIPVRCSIVPENMINLQYFAYILLFWFSFLVR